MQRSSLAKKMGNPSAIGECRTILHVFPGFGIGGVPIRTVRIINHFGRRFAHRIMSLDNRFDAAALLAKDLDVDLLPPPPRRRGMIGSALAARKVITRLRPDLLMTYNWGAIEWALANRLLPLCRHVHFEDGFGKEEADVQLLRRVLCRRWTLAHHSRVVVPSRQLETVALRIWKLPQMSVTYLPNGIDVALFAAPPRNAISGFRRHPGELVVGTLAPLRPEKNIARLLRVFAMLDRSMAARLIIAGDGTERAALERLAVQLGIADSVVFVGYVKPETVLGTFDVFAISSDTEQMPVALIEAMAAGRPVAGVDVGDVRMMVCASNREFIVPREDEAAFAASLRRLLTDQPLRQRLSEDNRARACSEFSQEQMFDEYSAIFVSSVATDDALPVTA
jgi:glycosyltransferase involved in cell wall biosynthesis